MTFGVTPEGFQAKRFADIVDDISTDLLTELGLDVDASPDSVAKILTNVFSLAVSEVWSGTQAMQSMLDIDKAESAHLDNLVGYLGLKRLSPVGSSGNVYVTSTKEVTLPIGTQYKDSAGNKYLGDNTTLITKTNCTSISVDIAPTIQFGDTIVMGVNGISYSKQVTVSVASTVGAMVADITSNTVTNLTTAVNTTVGSKYSITITNNNDKTPSSFSFSTNLILTSITGFGSAVRSEVGALGVAVGTVDVAPSISGVTSVTNRYPFTLGRLIETDVDLRKRHKLSLSTSGSATVEAIRADVLVVDGVTNAFVIENDTGEVTGLGQPIKSFLVVAKGGLSQDIGEAIWNSKGAGIQNTGDIAVTVVDSQGDNRITYFSRPTPIYTHINIQYTIYSEQSNQFPSNGLQQIQEQVVAFGTTLAVGEDVIPQRLATHIFNNVGGLESVAVILGKTTGANDTTPALTAAKLDISQVSEAVFASSRISVIEV